MAVVIPSLLIRTAIEAGFADLRRNAWLLDDVFAGMLGDPITDKEFGAALVARAKDWFVNTNVTVYDQFRKDLPTTPYVAIVDGGDTEMSGERTSLADDGRDEDFDPKLIKRTPQYVYPPFTPQKYDGDTGLVTMPKDLKADLVVPGQFFLSAKTGKAYQITEVVGLRTFRIKPGIRTDFTGAYIVPPTALWNLRREQTFKRHSCSIICASSGEPVEALWLNMIVEYCIMRYKEAYLEYRGYEVSSFQNGPLSKDERFEKENMYYKTITMSGQVELNWVKYVAPRLQDVKGGIHIIDGPRTPPGYADETADQAWDMEGDDTSLDGDALAQPIDGFPGYDDEDH